MERNLRFQSHRCTVGTALWPPWPIATSDRSNFTTHLLALMLVGYITSLPLLTSMPATSPGATVPLFTRSGCAYFIRGIGGVLCAFHNSRVCLNIDIVVQSASDVGRKASILGAL